MISMCEPIHEKKGNRTMVKALAVLALAMAVAYIGDIMDRHVK